MKLTMDNIGVLSCAANHPGELTIPLFEYSSASPPTSSMMTAVSKPALETLLNDSHTRCNPAPALAGDRTPDTATPLPHEACRCLRWRVAYDRHARRLQELSASETASRRPVFWPAQFWHHFMATRRTFPYCRVFGPNSVRTKCLSTSTRGRATTTSRITQVWLKTKKRTVTSSPWATVLLAPTNPALFAHTRARREILRVSGRMAAHMPTPKRCRRCRAQYTGMASRPCRIGIRKRLSPDLPPSPAREMTSARLFSGATRLFRFMPGHFLPRIAYRRGTVNRCYTSPRASPPTGLDTVKRQPGGAYRTCAEISSLR